MQKQIQPTFSIDEKLLNIKRPVVETAWCIWEKKTFNVHRGLIDWPETPCASIDVIARHVREGIRNEFKPGWFRGFGFGTVLHLRAVPADFCDICQHIDKRNRSDEVWQWVIVLFDREKIVLGIHTWLHGYLRPVYESVLGQLDAQGYQCHSVDTQVDPLIDALKRIARACNAIEGFSEIVS